MTKVVAPGRRGGKIARARRLEIVRRAMDAHAHGEPAQTWSEIARESGVSRQVIAQDVRHLTAAAASAATRPAAQLGTAAARDLRARQPFPSAEGWSAEEVLAWVDRLGMSRDECAVRIGITRLTLDRYLRQGCPLRSALACWAYEERCRILAVQAARPAGG